MFRKFVGFVALFAFVTQFSISGFAADMPLPDGADIQKALSDMAKEMDKMRQTIDQQNRKIQHLEQRGGAQPVPIAAPSAKPMKMSEEDFKTMLGKEIKEAKYFKNLKMGGDYRLRWEAFSQQETTDTTESRNRFRHRLRYGVENDVGDDMKVGFRIVTAGLSSTTPSSTSTSAGTVYASDPTSTNQTLGSPGLFSYNTIALDKAYAKYAPSKVKDYDLGILKVKKLELGGGKFDNPHLKLSSPMVWDGDVMPEGLYQRVDLNWYETESGKIDWALFAMQSPLVESGTGDRDSSLYSFGTALNIEGYTPMMERPVSYTSAFHTYLYRNYAEDSNSTLVSTSLTRGNTGCVGTAAAAGSGCQSLEAGDPRIVEIYNELQLSPMGVPLSFFSDVATNVNNGSVSGSSAQKNTAWGFGTTVGKLKEPKDWQLSYSYYQIPPNAVVGAFNDSDFGQGHANQRGSIVKAGYMMTKALQLNMAWFNVAPYDYTIATGTRDHTTNRFQTDLVWKF